MKVFHRKEYIYQMVLFTVYCSPDTPYLNVNPDFTPYREYYSLSLSMAYKERKFNPQGRQIDQQLK